jgi:hypothetical protein
MSPWDQIYVTTSLGADEVMNIFLDCLPEEAKTGLKRYDNSPELATANIDSTTIDIRPIKQIDYLSAFTNLDIVPTIELTFDTRNHLGHEYVYLATLKIIRTKGWDMVLVRDDTVIILIYLNGKLTIQKDDIFFTQARLEMIDRAYKTPIF